MEPEGLMPHSQELTNNTYHKQNYFKYNNYHHGLWNLEVQFRIHKSSPIILILSQPNTSY